jgi:DNA-directed RNA polymerase specialized sigma24 family protein
VQDGEPARRRRRPGRRPRRLAAPGGTPGQPPRPGRLPGWLATAPQAAALAPDAYNIRDDQAQNAEQELLAAERYAALCEAFTSLPPRYQQLITLLIHDPLMPYSQIIATLGVPVGSIGPLRSHPAIAALIDAETAATAGRR